MPVIAFPAKRDPHVAGEAFCLGCGHTWAAVAPAGTDRFECPACRRHLGAFKFECVPPPGSMVRVCNCGNQLFYMTTEGHLCPNCGTYQSY